MNSRFRISGGGAAGSIALIALLLASTSGADPLVVGDSISPFALRDQHDIEHRIDASVEIILFSRNMAAGKLIKEALEDTKPEALQSRGAVYVTDISGMPRLVAKLFALPSMRRRAYPMLLDRDGTSTARFPDGGEQATLIRCDHLEITGIRHLGDPTEIRRELGLPH